MDSWKEYLAEIQALIDSGAAGPHEDQLRGIAAWVEAHEYITPAQRRAVRNIKAESRQNVNANHR